MIFLPRPEPEVEKGALDSLSLKSENTDNSSPLISQEIGAGNNKQKSNGVVEGGSFDQVTGQLQWLREGMRENGELTRE